MRVLTDENERALIALYETGLGSVKVAREFGIHPNTVRSVLTRHGLTRRPHHEAVSKLTPEQRRYIVDRYQAGATIEDLKKELAISQSPIDDSLRAFGIEPRQRGAHRQYAIDETVFDSITEESAYWIGFLMADGCVFRKRDGSVLIRLELAKRDKGHVEKFCRFLKSSHPVGTQRAFANFQTSSRKLANALSKFGVVPGKSKRCAVAGLEYNRHFWRGMVDGDGSIFISKGSPYLVFVGQRQLMAQFMAFVQKHVPRYRGNILCRRHERWKPLWRVSLGGRNVATLCHVLYSFCTIALDRKHAIARQIVSFPTKKPGRIVRPGRAS